ncbi:MAG: hypothetical protein GC146_10965 [Limimaricola sp.]|uniref:YraN family protein n=1 Tax=Limimaricola sp. TaxID=2211665 RepID=UPI001D329DC9|nr:YraN family protein [Limimaricola sp.]MBI1417732.1 hypothetical protein [Limimaricola sp.]
MTPAARYQSGLAAEEVVAAAYARAGCPVLRRRWRGPGGEIDLIARDGDGLIFVEVKAARSFDTAAQRIGPRQQARIMASAAAFLEGEPRGQLTDVRFDVALVDRRGAVRLVRNAFEGG